MTYHERLRYYQSQVDIAQEGLRRSWFDNFDDVACEVVLNVLTTNWRKDVARGLIESYFQEFHEIVVGGEWILQQLEWEEYIGITREEVGWGEHDYFVYLRDRGMQVLEGLLPLLRWGE